MRPLGGARRIAEGRFRSASGAGLLSSDHYDLIVIGSGPGGASLAHRLAPSGKRILILERGDYLPRTEKNWNSQTVFVDAAYQAHPDRFVRRPPRPQPLPSEVWINKPAPTGQKTKEGSQ